MDSYACPIQGSRCCKTASRGSEHSSTPLTSVAVIAGVNEFADNVTWHHLCNVVVIYVSLWHVQFLTAYGTSLVGIQLEVL
jgi:hypothetical protein